MTGSAGTCRGVGEEYFAIVVCLRRVNLTCVTEGIGGLAPKLLFPHLPPCRL